MVGALKGAIAPGCTPVKLDDGDDNGDVGISDECAGEREALLGVGKGLAYLAYFQSLRLGNRKLGTNFSLFCPFCVYFLSPHNTPLFDFLN